MQSIIIENTLIKLTLYDETKKRAHDSQIGTRSIHYSMNIPKIKFIQFIYVFY